MCCIVVCPYGSMAASVEGFDMCTDANCMAGEGCTVIQRIRDSTTQRQR